MIEQRRHSYQVASWAAEVNSTPQRHNLHLPASKTAPAFKDHELVVRRAVDERWPNGLDVAGGVAYILACCFIGAFYSGQICTCTDDMSTNNKGVIIAK